MSTYDELLSEYNKLKEEFDEHKTIAEEYERELESTNKEYEDKIKELKDNNAKLIKEISSLKDDYLNFKEKNLSKMKEIEFLEKQIDKLKQGTQSGKEEKSALDRRIIELENENNDYVSKCRELECWADELKAKLDAALEENIMLHSENETCKAELEETIQRLEQEVKEANNEIASKEKIINGMSMHRDFLIKTAYNAQDDLNNLITSKSYQSLKGSSSGRINVLTPVNKNKRIPEKFMQSYSKTFLDKSGDDKSGDDKVGTSVTKETKENPSEKSADKTNDKTSTTNKREMNRNSSMSKSFLNKVDSINNDDDKYNIFFDRSISKRISAKQLEKYISRDLKGSIIINEEKDKDKDDLDDDDDDEEEREFIQQKIELEIKNILDSRRNFVINTLTLENFSFDFVPASKVATSSKTNNNPLTQKKSKLDMQNTQNKKIVENIDDILSKIQARKEKVMLQKKVMQSKLEKVGIKIF